MEENSSRLDYFLPENTMLDGRYHVLRVLGMGGFGITYEAVNEKVNRHVAVKEFFDRNIMARQGVEIVVADKNENENFREAKAKFLKEARRLGDFSAEPGIVHVLDYFEANNTAYIVMEYVDGISLARYLEQRGKVQPEAMFRLLMPLMETLDKVHKNGVIHRDISPDNIKLVKSENGKTSVKLLDFGSARSYMDNATYTIELKNGYAPLEQYSNSEQGPWTDVYALCAVLYRGITGEKPISATARAMNEKLLMPSQSGIHIDPRLERILKKGLSLHRENRYQSVGELLGELDPILTPKEKKPAGKKNLIFLGVSCAVCILGVGAFFGWNYYRNHEAYFKFHGKETAKVLLAPYDNVGSQDYEKDIRLIRKRLDYTLGKDNYLFTEREDGVELETPLDFFEKKQADDSEDMQVLSIGEYVEEYLTETVAAARRKALTVIRRNDDGTLDIARSTLKEDEILSAEKKMGKLPVEYDLPDDLGVDPDEAVGYVEVKVSEDAAKRIKKELADYLKPGTGITDSFMWFTTDPCYPELQNYTFCTDVDSDWTTYYNLLFSDDDRWKNLWKGSQLSETYQVLNTLSPEWETKSDMWGKYQCREGDIKGPSVCAEYESSETAREMKNKGDGNWLETVYDLKQRLDTLEIPYAFGISSEGRNKFVIKTAQKDVSKTLLNKLTEGVNSTEIKLSSGNSEEDFGNWDWSLKVDDSDGIKLKYVCDSAVSTGGEDSRNELKNWEQKAEGDKVALSVWGYELSSVKVDKEKQGEDLEFEENLWNEGEPFGKEDLPLLKFMAMLEEQTSSPLISYQLSEVRYSSREGKLESSASEEKIRYAPESVCLQELKSRLKYINEDAGAQEDSSSYMDEISVCLNRNTAKEYGKKTVSDIENLLKDTDWIRKDIWLKIYPGNRMAGEYICFYPGNKESGQEWNIQYNYTDDSDPEQQKIRTGIENSDILKQYMTDEDSTFTYAIW